MTRNPHLAKPKRKPCPACGRDGTPPKCGRDEAACLLWRVLASEAHQPAGCQVAGVVSGCGLMEGET